MRRGYTLVEMATLLVLLVLSLGFLSSGARKLNDRMAVLGAREAIAGLIAEVRVASLGRGGMVRVADGPWRAWGQLSDSTFGLVALESDFGVAMELPRGAREARLSYDVMGLGRVANTTLAFTRGAARAELVVSAYGRVRRR
jgi:hypothetical protein